MKIKVTSSTKDLLDKYDVNKLLTQTLPDDYFEQNHPGLSDELKLYKKRIDRLEEFTEIDVSLDSHARSQLNAIASNYDAPFAIVFNYLVSQIAQPQKINTKKIDQALDFYYNAVNNNPNLYLSIINAYADSSYYYGIRKDENGKDEEYERGVNDGGIAKFLVFTKEGRELMAQTQK